MRPAVMRSMFLAAIVCGSSGPLLAQTDDALAAAWMGAPVFPKENYVVKVGNDVVDSYDKPVLRLPWVVQAVNGQWLWVGGSQKGWVQRKDVVTLDEAPSYYTELIKRNADNVWAYNLRGLAWKEKNELDLAIADFDEVIKSHPNATVFDNRGNLWQLKQEYDKAIADYNQAIRLDPNNVLAFVGRGTAWRGLGKFDRAIADYNEALRINPHYARAYNNRGVAWAGRKNYRKAVADYEEAIRIDPSYASAYRDVAWQLATCADASFRDGRRALEFATRACELTGWASSRCLDTLAAAYAEVGDFESAIKFERRAIAHNQDDDEFVQGARDRLASFEQSKPWHE